MVVEMMESPQARKISFRFSDNHGLECGIFEFRIAVLPQTWNLSSNSSDS